jgi:iron complex transport system substrate-binding protein
MRICSFLPSATEILFALGLGDSVAGVTHECDFPPEAAKRPVLVRPRVDADSSPAEVDRIVSEFVARGQSLYGVDVALLRAIEPDLVLTQDLCHVCAASPDDLAAALAGITPAPRVLSLTPHTLADVWEDIRKVGEATGRTSEAETFIRSLEQRLADVEGAVSGSQERPRVLCLEWLDPPYVAGHWVPEMVARAKGVDVLGCAGKPSFRVEWRTVAAACPDVIIVMPCGYNIERTIDEMQKMKFPKEWARLPAVQRDRVFVVDANSYFSRPGPRLAAGVALLAKILHPACAVPFVPPGAMLRL